MVLFFQQRVVFATSDHVAQPYSKTPVADGPGVSTVLPANRRTLSHVA